MGFQKNVGVIITNKFWKELKENYKKVEFIDYDIDLNEEETKEYGNLDILPVVVFENDNKEIKRVIGEHTKQEFEEIIKDLLK